MGDRIVYYIDGAPCAAYAHWGGEGGLDTLREALPTMRAHDEEYATARLIAALCKNTTPPTGVGAVIKPTASDKNDEYVDYSHGDAGVVILSTDLQTVQCFAGYLQEKYPDPISTEAWDVTPSGE